ncbi:MAPEG family protein, partial [Lysobacter sp. GX 14042]|uniref:MAPEG family protein n=1 Tax=Lysobacter sp. GX 14042 TaxID=2907155 RepID=UPI001F3CD902
MNYATAYWCVLAAAVLPYVWTVIAKGSGKRFDNKDPRGWLQRQDNPRTARANAAQLNAFEAFPAFAASVLMAQLAGVDPGRAALLALVFVALRILHGIFYVVDLDKLRSLV